MAQAQKEVQFAEVTPMQLVRYGNVAVTVRITGIEADIHACVSCNKEDIETPVVKVPREKYIIPDSFATP